MKPALKYTLIGFFTILVLAYSGLVLWSFQRSYAEKKCRRYRVVLPDSTKVQLISRDDVVNLLDDNGINLKGVELKDINSAKIERILLRNKMILSAECFKTPSGLVEIRVKQRIPKLRVSGYDSYYVDENRQILPVSTNYAAYIPVVSGRVTKEMACGSLYDFVNFLEQNPFWNHQIEQIYVREDKKVELIPRVGDCVIELGYLENYEAKLGKLMKLYQKGFNIMGWNRYRTIDLQYKDQVVCGKEVPKYPEIIQRKDSTLTNKSVKVVDKDSIIASKI